MRSAATGSSAGRSSATCSRPFGCSSSPSAERSACSAPASGISISLPSGARSGTRSVSAVGSCSLSKSTSPLPDSVAAAISTVEIAHHDVLRRGLAGGQRHAEALADQGGELRRHHAGGGPQIGVEPQRGLGGEREVEAGIGARQAFGRELEVARPVVERAGAFEREREIAGLRPPGQRRQQAAGLGRAGLELERRRQRGRAGRRRWRARSADRAARRAARGSRSGRLRRPRAGPRA